MNAYYEEIMELWKAGDFFDAIGYFSQWDTRVIINALLSYLTKH